MILKRPAGQKNPPARRKNNLAMWQLSKYKKGLFSRQTGTICKKIDRHKQFHHIYFFPTYTMKRRNTAALEYFYKQG
jgi:hypothetical protein